MIPSFKKVSFTLLFGRTLLATALVIFLSTATYAAHPCALSFDNREEAAHPKNPWLDPIALNAGGVPEYSRFQPQGLLVAVKKKLQERDAAIAEIKSKSATFQNTILVLENTLSNTQIFSAIKNWRDYHETTDKWKDALERVKKLEVEYDLKVYTDTALFKKVEQVYLKKDGFSNIATRRLIEDVYENFLSNGVKLSEPDRVRMLALRQEEVALSSQFAKNGAKSEKKFSWHIKDAAELAGVPTGAMNVLRNAAKEKNLEGYYVKLDSPATLKILKDCTVEATRKKISLAFNRVAQTDGPFDNRPVVHRIARVRQEIAELLGYPDYTAYALKGRMVSQRKTLDAFMKSMVDVYLPAAKQEHAELIQFIRDLTGDQTVEKFYTERLIEKNRPKSVQKTEDYFTLERTLEEYFRFSEKMFDTRFVLAPDVTPPHPDATVYRVFNKKGEVIFFFVLDAYIRDPGNPNIYKEAGAWLDGVRMPVYDKAGNIITPGLAHIGLNEQRQPDGSTPISLRAAEIIFHEGGHLLHYMLSRAKFPSQYGTSVALDFVELPSQLLENFFSQPEVIRRIAIHKETGKKLSLADIKSLIAANNFRAGTTGLRQVLYGSLDLAWHSNPPAEMNGDQFRAFEWNVLKPISATGIPPVGLYTVDFSHIIDGQYSAGYYAYKWAEVLDADAFTYFVHHGVMSKRTANRFRKNILEVGASIDPTETYRNFTGGNDPNPRAMFIRAGLIKPDASE
jgi:peptidyl-dipeptidase Dcp